MQTIQNNTQGKPYYLLFTKQNKEGIRFGFEPTPDMIEMFIK